MLHGATHGMDNRTVFPPLFPRYYDQVNEAPELFTEPINNACAYICKRVSPSLLFRRRYPGGLSTEFAATEAAAARTCPR